MSNFFDQFEDDKEKTADPMGRVRVTPSSVGQSANRYATQQTSGNFFDQYEPKPSEKQEVVAPVATEPEKKQPGIISKVGSAFGGAIMGAPRETAKGLDMIFTAPWKAADWTGRQLNKVPAYKSFMEEAAAGIDQGKGKAAMKVLDTSYIFGKAAAMDFKPAMNTAIGGEIIDTLTDKTSNLGLKTAAKGAVLRGDVDEKGGLGEFTLDFALGLGFNEMGRFRKDYQAQYDKALIAWEKSRYDEDNNFFEQVMFDIQDSGAQSMVGVLIAAGTTFATKNPKLGMATAMPFYASLSAGEQRQEKGEVYSSTNILIDTVGDSVINAALSGLFKMPANTILKIFATSQIEGATEVAQSLAKFQNNYLQTDDEAEKQAIIDDAKTYVTSGAIWKEYIVGAVVGGVASGGLEVMNTAGSGGTGKRPEEQATTDTVEPGTPTVPPPANALDILTQEDSGVVLSPEQSVQAQEARIVFNDYAQATEERTFLVPNIQGDQTSGAPIALVEVNAVQVGDKIAVRYSADAGDTSLIIDYNLGTLFDSVEQANKTALSTIADWAASQLNNVDVPVEAKARLEEIIKGTQRKARQKPATPPATTQAGTQPAPAPTAKGYAVGQVVTFGGTEYSIKSIEGTQPYQSKVILETADGKIMGTNLAGLKTAEKAARNNRTEEEQIKADREALDFALNEAIKTERNLSSNELQSLADKLEVALEIVEARYTYLKKESAKNAHTKTKKDKQETVIDENTDAAIEKTVETLTERYPDGVSLYHYTSSNAKENIDSNGFVGDAKADEVYFILGEPTPNRSTSSDNTALIEIRLNPSEYARIGIDRGSYEGRSEAEQYLSFAEMVQKGEKSLDVTLLADDANRLLKTTKQSKPKEKKAVLPSTKKTQKEKVKQAVEQEGEASIKDIAEITGILEPNVRRILGVGAKTGEFERVDAGVYRLTTPDGKEVAVIMAADAVETIPKLAKQGFKADMVFLDIPYETNAVKGGNRGVKYDFLSVEDFRTILDSLGQIMKSENSPVIHMYSQAPSGMAQMQKYNDAFIDYGFTPVAKGEWQKTFKDGSPVTSPNGKVAKPEGIVVFTQSGETNTELESLQFKTVRPKGYQTEKPAEMLRKMIEMTTNEGDVVFDPFAGSGVTGAEAVASGRRTVAIEKNKEVLENITKPRIEGAVPKKSVLPSTKKKAEPKTYKVYRGTESYTPLQESMETDYGDGYYFAKKKSTAEGYGNVVGEYTVNLNNPLKVKDRYEMNGIVDEYLAQKEAGETKAERLREYLEAQGYDGVEVENGGLAGQKGVGGFVIAFRQEAVVEQKPAEKPAELKVQYHGTQQGEALREAIKNGTVRASESGIIGKGFYLTPTESAGAYFGKQIQTDRGRIMNGVEPDVLAIDISDLNIKVLPYGKGEYYDFLDENGYVNSDVYNQALQKEGFDGLYLEGRGETIIFDPKKVKLVEQNNDIKIPDVVYHGTLADFEVFDNNKVGVNTEADNASFGTFFIADEKRAIQFVEDTRKPGDTRPVKIKEAKINLKNPLDLTLSGITTKESQAKFLYELLWGEGEAKPNLTPAEALMELDQAIDLDTVGELSDGLYLNPDNRQKMIDAGYDGIVSAFGRDNGKTIYEYVVFDAKNIQVLNSTPAEIEAEVNDNPAKKEYEYNRKVNELIESYAVAEAQIEKLNTLQSTINAQEDLKAFKDIQTEIDANERGNQSVVRQLAEKLKSDEYSVIEALSAYVDIGKRREGRTVTDFYKYLPGNSNNDPVNENTLPAEEKAKELVEQGEVVKAAIIERNAETLTVVPDSVNDTVEVIRQPKGKTWKQILNKELVELKDSWGNSFVQIKGTALPEAKKTVERVRDFTDRTFNQLSGDTTKYSPAKVVKVIELERLTNKEGKDIKGYKNLAEITTKDGRSLYIDNDLLDFIRLYVGETEISVQPSLDTISSNFVLVGNRNNPKAIIAPLTLGKDDTITKKFERPVGTQIIKAKKAVLPSTKKKLEDTITDNQLLIKVDDLQTEIDSLKDTKSPKEAAKEAENFKILSTGKVDRPEMKVTKTKLKDVLPVGKDRMIFTVIEDTFNGKEGKYLSYVDEQSNTLMVPAGIGLSDANLRVGQEVILDVTELKESGRFLKAVNNKGETEAFLGFGKPKLTKQEVTAILAWQSGTLNAMTPRLAKKLRPMKIGFKELRFDSNGNVTGYRNSKPRAGRPAGFNATRKTGLTEYTVNKNDVIIYLGSREFESIVKKVAPERLAQVQGFRGLENEFTAVLPVQSTPRRTIRRTANDEFADVSQRVQKAEGAGKTPSRLLSRTPVSEQSKMGDSALQESELQKGSELELDKLVKRSEIAKVIKTKLNAVVRSNKIRGKALGIYKRNTDTIRIRSNAQFQDGGQFAVLIHEIGHYVDFSIANFRSLIPKQEIKPLLSNYGGGYDSVPANKKRSEGFAEFLRYYVTKPEVAKQKAPVFYKLFEDTLAKTHPEVMEVFKMAQTDYKRWEEQPATAKIAAQISFEQKEDGSIKEKLYNSSHELYKLAVNDLHALAQFSSTAKEVVGEIQTEKDPYKLARNLRGWIGRAQYFLETGTLSRDYVKRDEKGNISIEKKGKSLKEILQPIEDKGALTDFSVFLTARRAVELNERNIATGITAEDAVEALSELQNKHPEFEKASQEINKYQNDLLDYLEESEVINGEIKGKIKKMNQMYVPFHRVQEELSVQGYLGGKKIPTTSPIKRIKGSEKDIVDPLESIVKNTYTLINAAERNNVMLHMAELAKADKRLGRLMEQVPGDMSKVASVNAKDIVYQALGADSALGRMMLPSEAQEAIDILVPNEMVDIFRPAFMQKGNVVTVLEKGKPVHYELEADLYDAVNHLSVEDSNLFVKIIRIPASTLRAGATLTPEFMARNPLRDTLQAGVFTKYNFIPVYDTIRGLASFIKKDAYFQAWQISGGMQATLVAQDRKNLQQTKEELVSWKARNKKYLNPLEGLRLLSEATEIATRLGEARLALQAGKSPEEAAFAAREITLDFQRNGTKFRALNHISAFFNAKVQGNDRIVRGFKDDPMRSLSKSLLYITLPSILLYFVNRDEEGWDEIPAWQKNIFWLIKINGTWYRIPKPFELGVVFGSLPERFLEYIDTKDRSALDAAARDFVVGLVPNPTPTGAVPLIENLFNYSLFLDRPIVPRSQENLPPEDQYSNSTSDIAKILGGTVKYSPAKIDNLIKGYFAGLGTYFINAVDQVLQGTGIVEQEIKPTPTKADIPVVKAFVVREPIGSGSNSVNDFYEARDKANRYETKYKLLVKEGQIDKAREYLAEHPEIHLTKTYNSVASQIADIRKLRNQVYNSKTLSPDEKREKIDELDRIMTQYTYNVINLELE